MEILEKTDTLTRVKVDGREITLVGTAHVSHESVEQVKSVIAAEMPERVCVELDERRFKSLREKSRCYVRSDKPYGPGSYIYYWVGSDGAWDPQWDTENPDLRKYYCAE